MSGIEQLLLQQLETVMQQQAEILKRLQVREMLPADQISFSVREASRLTGINYNTLYKMCKTGDIPYSQPRDGGSMVILSTDLADFLLRNNTASQKSLLDGKNGVRKRT